MRITRVILCLPCLLVAVGAAGAEPWTVGVRGGMSATAHEDFRPTFSASAGHVVSGNAVVFGSAGYLPAHVTQDAYAIFFGDPHIPGAVHGHLVPIAAGARLGRVAPERLGVYLELAPVIFVGRWSRDATENGSSETDLTAALGFQMGMVAPIRIRDGVHLELGFLYLHSEDVQAFRGTDTGSGPGPDNVRTMPGLREAQVFAGISLLGP